MRAVDGSLTDVLSLDLPCDDSAPSRVRSAIARLEPLNRICEDAKLVASELVSSAVIQSGPYAGKVIHVNVKSAPDRVLISVGGFPNRVRPSKDAAAAGWGARVVQRLARRWGAERWEGYRFWAELAAGPSG